MNVTFDRMKLAGIVETAPQPQPAQNQESAPPTWQEQTKKPDTHFEADVQAALNLEESTSPISRDRTKKPKTFFETFSHSNSPLKQVTLTPPLGASQSKVTTTNHEPRSSRGLYLPSESPSRADPPDKGVKYAGGDGNGSVHTSPLHIRSSHHPFSLRSDSYLRQALTSPYNQRSEKFNFLGSSPLSSRSKDALSVCSPSMRRDRESPSQNSPGLLETGGAGLHDNKPKENQGQPAVDQMSVFKTPKIAKRMVFASPDKARRERTVSGSSSPLSSGGSSSSSGRHRPHHNPFDQGDHRLHFPVFSPNMFDAPDTPGRSDSDRETFQWNLEHIAELRPIHIDDKEIRRQMLHRSPDEESELRAQRAIDYYFQHHMVAPSPWAENPPPHVLPVTPANHHGYGLMAETPDERHGSIQKELNRHKKITETKSCQTVLTLPADFDLEKILGEHMNYQDGEENGGRDSMSSSSLRRKLFFNADSSSILSPVRTGQRSPDHVSAALRTPPHSSKCTPEWERDSPLHTPSSVQFSSSPIRGPLSEGDYFRASFDHGGLASPELSPIADKHRVKSRRSHAFFEEGETELGSRVRQQLQMEMHDGNSPPALPSPDVSPIIGFGSESGPHSKSRTLRVDASTSLFSSPHHSTSLPHSKPDPSPVSSHPHPLPFSNYTQGALSPHQSASVDADMDFLPVLSEKNFSHLDTGDTGQSHDGGTMVGTGEEEEADGGLSGFDPGQPQHPGSLSNLDTGYQTGSGNGSLQTTQDGISSSSSTTTASATTITISSVISDTFYGHSDTGAHLVKRITARLQSSDVDDLGCVPLSGADGGGPGFMEEGEGERKPRLALAASESSVDAVGSSVDGVGSGGLHSNLTSQFMSLPFRSELSADSFDLESIVGLSEGRPEVLICPMDVSEEKPKHGSCESSSSRPWRDLNQRGARRSNSAEKSSDMESLGNTSQGSKGFVIGLKPVKTLDREVDAPPPNASVQSDSVHITEVSFPTPSGGNFYDRDAEFLYRVADYLEKGGDLTTDYSENLKGAAADASSNQIMSAVSAMCGEKEKDAAVTAIHPTFAVNFEVKGHSAEPSMADDSVLQRARQYLASVNNLSGEADAGMERENSDLALPGDALGSSTPTKRFMGKVAEDLVAVDGSPALASEVASEILRRAEQDLKRVDRATHKTDSL